MNIFSPSVYLSLLIMRENTSVIIIRLFAKKITEFHSVHSWTCVILLFIPIIKILRDVPEGRGGGGGKIFGICDVQGKGGSKNDIFGGKSFMYGP